MTRTPMHSIRITPDLWDAAQAEAERRGETVSDAVRRSLKRYVRPRQTTTREHDRYIA